MAGVCGSGLDKEEQNRQLITRQIEYSTFICIKNIGEKRPHFL